MTAEEFEKEFLAMSEEDQMKVVRTIMPVFCRGMMGNPARMREMFSLITEECGGPMASMISMMGRKKGRGGGCCCG